MQIKFNKIIIIILKQFVIQRPLRARKSSRIWKCGLSKENPECVVTLINALRKYKSREIIE